MTAKNILTDLDAPVAALRSRLLAHEVFRHVRSLPALRGFMEAHVFAVWDFMSLVKTLQRQLTSTQVPWLPPANRQAARFINEIVLAEESDEIAPGNYVSHFELYLEAMRECGARTSSIEALVRCIGAGGDVEAGLRAAEAPPFVAEFVRATIRFCALAPHEVAAAFLHGREDIIPEMFRRLLSDGEIAGRRELGRLELYLDRHVELDGDTHGPMARRLMHSLCGDDAAKWREAGIVAGQALEARICLWDGVLKSATR